MMLAHLPLGAVKLPAWFSDNMVLQQTDTETSLPLRSFLSGLAALETLLNVDASAACPCPALESGRA